MVDRNTTIGKKGFIYFPLQDTFYPYWKIIITGDDGVDYYISDFVDGSASRNYLINARVTRPLTNSLGSFVVKFANPDKVFSDKFDGGEVIKIYADYTDASTLQFRGKIDNVYKGVNGGDGFFLEVDGRDYPEMGDRTVTGRDVTSTADVALCDLFNDYFTNVTLAFWNGTDWITATYNDTTRTVTWSGDDSSFPADTLILSYQNKKGWTAIGDICKRVDLECYMDYDDTNSRWTLRVFNKESIKNDSVSITYGENIISFGNYGYDNGAIKNLVTVYGKQESDNIILMATEEDSSSQTNLWIKEKIINDSSLTAMDEVRDKAEYELSEGTTIVLTGNASIVGAHNIKPGERVMVGIPGLDISGYHTLGSITHRISNSGFTTDVDFTKSFTSISDLFKEKLNLEDEAKPFINLNKMKDSYTIYFNESNSKIETHSNTEESDGKLVLSSGQTLGVATTAVHVSDYNIVECEFRKYSNFPIDDNDTYEVSNDNGITWETYDMTSGETHTFSSTGKNLKFRMTLRRDSANDTSPTYESVCILYK